MRKATVTIIQEVGDDRYILKCARCNGKGREPEAFGAYSRSPCRVCKGKGVVGVEIINGSPPFVICQRCEGKGREPEAWGKYSTEPCRICKGVGAQPISGEMKILH